jgi:Arc/MetJ-type ribon-helix-helix transcriptional regulator
VRQELAYGGFASEDELLLEAVRLLHQREEDLRNFKAKLQGRLDRLDHGKGIELEGEALLWQEGPLPKKKNF